MVAASFLSEKPGPAPRELQVPLAFPIGSWQVCCWAAETVLRRVNRRCSTQDLGAPDGRLASPRRPLTPTGTQGRNGAIVSVRISISLPPIEQSMKRKQKLRSVLGQVKWIGSSTREGTTTQQTV